MDYSILDNSHDDIASIFKANNMSADDVRKFIDDACDSSSVYEDDWWGDSVESFIENYFAA